MKKSNPTCVGKNNGSVSITATAHFDYLLSINGPNGYIKEELFTHENEMTISNLGKGKYTICVSSPDDDDFERCYETEFFEPDPLQVLTQLNALDLSVTIDLSGGENYNLKLNSSNYRLQNGRHQFALRSGLNLIEVSTDLNCQGKMVKEIYVSEDSSIYPNPASEVVNILVGGDAMKAKIMFFNLQGDLLHQRDVVLGLFNRSCQISVDSYTPGLYLIRVISADRIENFKFLKR